MARIGVDYETVKHSAIKLLSQGDAPSVQRIREMLGTGSNTTIAEHLKIWREEHAKKTVHYLPESMPKELVAAFDVLWQTAMEYAQNQLAEYKKAIETEREIALQKKTDAEKVAANTQLKIEEFSAQLIQEKANNQNLVIELAIAKDRIDKKDETLSIQKNQYEDRLKRLYDEKDKFIIEFRHLQIEINTLHEKLTSQAEEHKRILAQQYSLQEQSETRWLKLIDQARQETKEERNKLESIRHSNDEQLKKIELKLTESQKNTYEKEAHLKVALEQISLLKIEINKLKEESSSARSIIVNPKKARQLTLAKKTVGKS